MRRLTLAAAAALVLSMLAVTGGRPASAEPVGVVPTITSTGGSPAVVRDGTPLTFSWTATDDVPAGLAFDVEYHSDDSGPGWHRLRSGTGTSSITYNPAAASRVCFRVQATDADDNRSAWSMPRCTSIDTESPWMWDDRHQFAHPTILRTLGGRLTYRVRAEDDVRVASYDVQQRTAPAGRGLGDWAFASRGRSRSSNTYVTSIRAGQERCFRARARDAVGRVSTFADRWCVVAPSDDRAFPTRGGDRLRVPRAIGGTVTRLRQVGDTIGGRSLVGRKLWVLAKGDPEGCPEVWWGGRLVMDRICGSTPGPAGFTWYATHTQRAPRLHRGPIRIVAESNANQILVDAIAVQR